jgi:hypothetical protein
MKNLPEKNEKRHTAKPIKGEKVGNISIRQNKRRFVTV